MALRRLRQSVFQLTQVIEQPAREINMEATEHCTGTCKEFRFSGRFTVQHSVKGSFEVTKV